MIHTRDSRTTEADSAFHHYVQQGCDPDAVAAVLPMLVSSRPEVAQRAGSFLMEHGQIGLDTSPEGQRHAQAVVSAARNLTQQALERGDFAHEPGGMFRTGSRYAPSENAIHEELDRITPSHRYPEAEGNSRRLAMSEAEKSLPYGHRLDDEGNVLDRAGQKTGERVELPQGRNVVVRDGMVRNAEPQRSASFVHYSSAETGEWDSSLGARPYFVED